MSSGEQKKKDDTVDTSNNKVTPRSHDPSNYNYSPVMGEKYKWKMDPQIIISAVTSKTQDTISLTPDPTYPLVDPTKSDVQNTMQA